jgi:hypothetical protein
LLIISLSQAAAVARHFTAAVAQAAFDQQSLQQGAEVLLKAH